MFNRLNGTRSQMDQGGPAPYPTPSLASAKDGPCLEHTSRVIQRVKSLKSKISAPWEHHSTNQIQVPELIVVLFELQFNKEKLTTRCWITYGGLSSLVIFQHGKDKAVFNLNLNLFLAVLVILSAFFSTALLLWNVM